MKRNSDTITRRSGRWSPILVCLGLLVAGTLNLGCSTGPPRAAPVDAPEARKALRTTLEHWKDGGRPEALLTGSPSITVQDMDWEAGLDLAEYRVIDDGKNDDANLRIPVELTLRDPKGRPIQKRVTYIVGTSPSTTVFREVF